MAPPTLNLDEPDGIFHDKFAPIRHATRREIRAVLSNSFGFGGTNASLLFASS